MLRRTHELLSDYVQLPCWQGLWGDANAAAPSLADGPAPARARAGAAAPLRGAVGDAVVQGVVSMLCGALYDTQQQVLVAPAGAGGGGRASAQGCFGDSACGGDEVSTVLAALAAPCAGYFGHPHLGALLELEGDWALQALLEAALGVFEAQQVGPGNWEQ